MVRDRSPLDTFSFLTIDLHSDSSPLSDRESQVADLAKRSALYGEFSFSRETERERDGVDA